jgi:hypothetical protein
MLRLEQNETIETHITQSMNQRHCSASSWDLESSVVINFSEEKRGQVSHSLLRPKHRLINVRSTLLRDALIVSSTSITSLAIGKHEHDGLHGARNHR